tara:strand:+ start:4128 stop:4577 length:450 start_codon:yes stop_codon:yes gene_type:complete
MAYVNQEDKKTLSPAIKAVLKKYNMKGTIGIRNHSTLIVKLKSGAIDFLEGMSRKNRESRMERNTEYTGSKEAAFELLKEQANCDDVNEYWIDANYVGDTKDFLLELKSAMEGPDFFNDDDSMTDYFHRSHYIDIQVGKDWKTPYQQVA